ncbi:hypothetical protein ACHAXT_007056 [Thalassiosira profunda]
MGQAPSIAELPPEWEEILPNVTKEDILRSSRKKCKVVGEAKSVYLDSDIFDLDEHVPMALAILRAHPHLKDTRFQLVPGRMSEERYWAALFGILNDGGLDLEDVVGKIGDDYETGDEMDDGLDVGENEEALLPAAQSPIEPTGKPKKKGVRTPIATLELDYYDERDTPKSKADVSNTPPFYLDEIKEQQAHIARLQKSLREANHKNRKLALELHKERKKRHEGGDHSGSVASCPRCNSSLAQHNPHTGTWTMHPDCGEFMKLDDHLKDNLRKEKEKRLNEVLSQMKFILDTDDIKDSYGKWSCCGKEEYGADCSA